MEFKAIGKKFNSKEEYWNIADHKMSLELMQAFWEDEVKMAQDRLQLAVRMFKILSAKTRYEFQNN